MAFQVGGTLRPLPLGGALKGPRLSAFYDADKHVKHGPRNRFVAAATFEHKYVNAAFDYLATTDRPAITATEDRKSTRLNSSHQIISYAVFCLKKKKKYSTIKR